MNYIDSIIATLERFKLEVRDAKRGKLHEDSEHEYELLIQIPRGGIAYSKLIHICGLNDKAARKYLNRMIRRKVVMLVILHDKHHGRRKKYVTL